MYEPIETDAQFAARIRLAADGEDATPEGLHLEFKEFEAHLNQDRRARDEARRELARDITQFANADGGSLVLGVAEAELPDGRRGAGQAVGVQEPDRAIEFIADARTTYTHPAFLRAPVARLRFPGGEVLVVNVEPTAEMIAVFHRGHPRRGMEFLYRTNHGKQWFTPDEVAMRLHNRHRTTRLELVELLRGVRSFPQTPASIFLYHESDKRNVPPVLPWYGDGGNAQIVRLGQMELELKLWTDNSANARTITVPYDWLAAYWWHEAGPRRCPALQVRAHFRIDGKGVIRINPAEL